MATYPAMLELVGDVHEALTSVGVSIDEAHLADPMVVVNGSVFRVVNCHGCQRLERLAHDIDTTDLLARWSISVDTRQWAVYVRPDGGEIVVAEDHGEHVEFGCVLLLLSGMETAEHGLADYAEEP